MKSDKKKIKSKEMFDSLVRNAIDFLEHSAFELEEKPKYSVINFCTAVELFLKARLMLEHWNLIYEDPKIANFTQFLQGNFKSVGMIDAIGRLKKSS
jgi:HEPN domain-containing protein